MDGDWCEVCGGLVDSGWCGCAYAELEGAPLDLQDWIEAGVTRADFVRAAQFLEVLGNAPAVLDAHYDAVRYAVHSA